MTNEDQMFRMLLAGKTFAEAAWSATEQLGYVNTVVGDPLMTWKQLLPGDVNEDGKVNMSDLAILGADMGKTVPAGGAGWAWGDLNNDGVVNYLDLQILMADWGQTSSWATTGVQTAAPPNFSTAQVPEPYLRATRLGHGIARRSSTSQAASDEAFAQVNVRLSAAVTILGGCVVRSPCGHAMRTGSLLFIGNRSIDAVSLSG